MNYKLVPLYIGLFLFAIYSLTLGGHFYSPDEEIMFRVTESLSTGEGFAVEPLMGFGTRTGLDGKQYAQYGVGQSFAAIPLYKMSDWIAGLNSPEFAEVFDSKAFAAQYHDRTVDEYIHRLGVGRFNQIVCALLGVVVYLFAFKIYGSRRIAIYTALIFGLCTIVWPHSRTFFSEPLAGFFLLIAFYLLYLFGNDEPDIKYLLLAGLASGGSLLVRLDSAIMVAGISVYALFVICLRAEKPLKNGLLFFLPILLFIGVIGALNYEHYGSFTASGYSDQPEGVSFSTPLLVGLYGFLFSIGRSIFVFSPVLILTPWALLRWRQQKPVLTFLYLLPPLLFFLAMAKWVNWSGGWDWGPRHLFQLMPFLVLPLGELFVPGAVKWNPTRRVLFALLLATSLAVQFIGVSGSPVEVYARMNPEILPQMVYVPYLSIVTLQFRYILAGNVDLFFAEIISSDFLWWKLLLLGFIAMAGFSLFKLVQVVRKENLEI